MHRASTLLASIVFALILAPTFARAQTTPATAPATQPAAAPADLLAAIDQAIKLLEEGKLEDLINRFMPPKLKAEELKAKTLAQLAAEMKPEVNEALKSLRAARQARPTLSAGGTRATYDSEDITFEKIDGAWYIAD
jgi:hypothetical protein